MLMILNNVVKLFVPKKKKKKKSVRFWTINIAYYISIQQATTYCIHQSLQVIQNQQFLIQFMMNHIHSQCSTRFHTRVNYVIFRHRQSTAESYE